MIRELREEVGIEATPAEALPLIEHCDAHASMRLHPFICRSNGSEAQADRSLEERRIDPSSLMKYHFPEANHSLLESHLRRDFAKDGY